MKQYILSTLLLVGFALEATESTLSLRNREAGGVGYNQGYSTIDYLLTHNWQHQELLFNLRGHAFNNGRLAANAGLGFRQSCHKNKCLIGGNFFYDLRESKYIFSQQLGAGLEFLSKHLDVRLNGYLPIGKKSDFESKTFTGFTSHSILVKQKVHAALPSAELEFGTLLQDHFYLAAGPYYLFDKEVRGFHLGNAWGGRARVEIDLGKYLSVGGILTHDQIFNTRFQGYLSINIPLGKRDLPRTQAKRNLRRVPIYRNEIIPMEKKTRTTPLYTGSETSDTVNVVFVNNAFEGSSDGSFEAPFTSLQEAENNSAAGDIIYVYPGNDVPYLMEPDFSLKPDQQLASSSVPIEVEDVVIPPSTPGHDPVIFVPPSMGNEGLVPQPPPVPLEGFRMLDPWEYIFGPWDAPAHGSFWDGGGSYDDSSIGSYDPPSAISDSGHAGGHAGSSVNDNANINASYYGDDSLVDSQGSDSVVIDYEDAVPGSPPDSSSDGSFEQISNHSDNETAIDENGPSIDNEYFDN